jgi:hypothetical protein
MNKLFNFTKWASTASMVVALVFLTACPTKNGTDPQTFQYPQTTIEVGATGSVTPEVIAGDQATYAIIDIDGADFVSIDPNSGVLSVGAESTTGDYSIKVMSSNEGGSSSATAEIKISVNDEFDLSGKDLLWKYWMNNTPDVVMLNLNLLPGQEALPSEIPIPVGWPANWPAINFMDPTLESYFVFPTVQYFLQQVPGDDVCATLDPAEEGDTLLLIVNPDLTLSTVCQGADTAPGTTVDLGTSSISYDGDAFSWTLDLTLQGVPVAIEIGGAEFIDFMDPLDPHWTAPSGVPRTFPAVVGTVEQYMTPTDFHPNNYLSSLQLLNVDVVLEILE